jgi:hypothetical protein
LAGRSRLAETALRLQRRELEAMKIFAYVISSLIGYAIGHYLLQGAVAAFASILISYHLYLVYLVLTAKHEKGLSFPIGQAILTHAAFLVVLLGLPFLRHQIPFFSLLSLLVPGLAPFETQWLFSGPGPVFKKVDEQKPAVPVVTEVTSEDQQEFVQYLRQAHRPFKKARMTIDDEFKAWHADRVKKRAEAAAGAAPGPSMPLD